jgi:hypothetical protein
MSAAAVRPDRLQRILGQAQADRGRLDGGAFGLWSLTSLGIASVVGAASSSAPASPPRSTPARRW